MFFILRIYFLVFSVYQKKVQKNILKKHVKMKEIKYEIAE